MLVIDKQNTYNFANVSIQLTDNTVISDDTVTPEPEVPRFNILIPTVQDVGVTNVVELFYPGEVNRYLLAHGNPNAMKFGFGPDLIHQILNTANNQVGVYTVNLRGPSATAANLICKMMYKVEADVAYTDEEGNPYYVTEAGELTTEPSGNTPVVRDVLKVKFVLDSATGVTKWTDLFKYMNEQYSETEDDEGYKTIPWFAVMYKGVSAYGNNSYFTLEPMRAEYDGNIYYTAKLFDGVSSKTSTLMMSMDPNAGSAYGENYYIETQFNSAFGNYKFLSSDFASQINDLINKYLYNVDEWIAGTQNAPSTDIAAVDVFRLSSFAAEVETGSLDIALANTFTFANGSDGTETADQLYEMFFNRQIIPDVSSVLKYRFNYIPDLGWNDATKTAIVDLMKRRVRMTVATFMLGGEDTMASALVDHQANWFENNPTLRLITRAQSAMRYNSWTRRTMLYPSGYLDTEALIAHFIKWSNYYQPFAGADARWSNYIADTMTFANEDTDTINAFYNNRVNIVMQDRWSGAYLSEQLMNMQFASDQLEFNNALLISNMLYDLVELVHRNHYKFNESAEVQTFKTNVDDSINRYYAQYAASLSVDVYRVGTVGRAKSANKIKVTIDMKDISKYADIELILTDS